MSIDSGRVRQLLKAFDFQRLFIEELGWDRHVGHLDVQISDTTHTLAAVAQKRGMVVFLCTPADSGPIPDYPTRRKIERQVTKSSHEHFIIYIDADKTTQIWQWVKREPRKPAACREHSFHPGHTGEALAQRLSNIAFALEEEEGLTVVTVAGRAQVAFDVERVTRRFYDYFKSEHASFLKFLKGIPDEQMQRWYVSVMLNRLMFIYFIQKKGFLDDDRDYLRNKLAQSKSQGKDRFYRRFLCPLFFEGFAKRPQNRSAEMNQLLGKVPFLNGGLFLRHQIEELHGEAIQIPDGAFDKLFAFFDRYHWHLDERPLRRDDEINPDVLGYIFEKYINQKQMGAYYTKEDITGYITRNTVIPFLFDAAKKKCKVAFEPGQYIWRLLQEDPDRYIYPSVRRGVVDEQGNVIPLPKDIKAGVRNVAKRNGWNRSATDPHALPTETWREHVARRQRCLDIRDKLRNGTVHQINDLVTLNLDIEQFAQDVIENCEGPELLRAFWRVIERVTVLDPACGSGAFLFAALNILESVYEACLDHMQAFLDELERSGKKHRPEKFSDFRKVLEQVAKHPNRKYFIYKSIVINNLYGVDIMEEAVEICKLRLFLKLVAQIDRVEDIEPLPDIDFNIRAGNTLVGYPTYDSVKKAVESKLDFDNAMARIEEKAADVDHLFGLFRQQQTELGGTVTVADKEKLQTRLKSVEDELNGYLATEYGVDTPNKNVCDQWLNSHKPFHWFVDYYGVMKNGGFDVIIGNPPYVEYQKVKGAYAIHNYTTETCGNLYAYFVERSTEILVRRGRFGMIIQLPIVCTDRMKPLQRMCISASNSIWFANFDDRPGRLFDGLQHIRATIVVSQKNPNESTVIKATTYNRWYTEARSALFDRLEFCDISDSLVPGAIPKIGHEIVKQIKRRIAPFPPAGNEFRSIGSHLVYFHNAPHYWVRAMDYAPYFWNERDGEQLSTHIKILNLTGRLDAAALTAALNSSLFYWWFIAHSDCRDLNMREIERFPLGLGEMNTTLKEQLATLKNELMADYKRNARRKRCYYRTTGEVAYDEFFPGKSKSIMDKIDRVLARHFGFTEEELDFIINYDIKYRMGSIVAEGDE